jgi:hypothetical protein
MKPKPRLQASYLIRVLLLYTQAITAPRVRLNIHGREEVLQAAITQVIAHCAKAEKILQGVLHQHPSHNACKCTYRKASTSGTLLADRALNFKFRSEVVPSVLPCRRYLPAK